MTITESIVEDAALEWFGELGYAIGHGPEMAPGGTGGVGRRTFSWGSVVMPFNRFDANSGSPDHG